MTLSPTLALACLLYIEARGEGEDGIRMVAAVAYNRAFGDPANVYAVCMSRAWNGERSLRAIRRMASTGIRQAKRNPGEWQAWLLCVQVATEVMQGDFVPYTRATHFHADDGRERPWTKRMICVGLVGRHLFWEEKRLDADVRGEVDRG